MSECRRALPSSERTISNAFKTTAACDGDIAFENVWVAL